MTKSTYKLMVPINLVSNVSIMTKSNYDLIVPINLIDDIHRFICVCFVYYITLI